MKLKPVYEVEKILDAKKFRNKYRYLVKWKGYSSEENTWESDASFDDKGILKKFWEKQNANSKKNKGKVVKMPLMLSLLMMLCLTDNTGVTAQQNYLTKDTQVKGSFLYCPPYYNGKNKGIAERLDLPIITVDEG